MDIFVHIVYNTYKEHITRKTHETDGKEALHDSGGKRSKKRISSGVETPEPGQGEAAARKVLEPASGENAERRGRKRKGAQP